MRPHPDDDDELDELGRDLPLDPSTIEVFGPDPTAQIGLMVVLKDEVLDVLDTIARDRGITIVEAAQRLIEEGVEDRRARDRAAAAAAAARAA